MTAVWTGSAWRTVPAKVWNGTTWRTCPALTWDGSSWRTLGAAPAWTPASLPGLVGWYDAADAATITASAGAVSQWADKSGHGRHLIQATGSRQPHTGATLNGHPALGFDGAGGPDCLQCFTADQYTTPPVFHDFYTWAIAFQKTGAANTYEALVSASPTDPGKPFETWNGNRIIYTHVVASTATNIQTVTVPTVLVSHGARVASTINEYRDGVAAGASTDPLIGSEWHESEGGQTLTVGSRGDYVTAFTGSIGEVVFAEAALTSTDRAALEAYLRAKWGTP